MTTTSTLSADAGPSPGDVAATPVWEVGPATILVVDDIADNRLYLVTLLRFYGHRLLQAADGREGLAVARAELPDLIISDVLMPVMDGYEFVKQLRLDPTTTRIPVVFYTAHYSEREATNLALASGVSAVLSKPVAAADVRRIVGQVLAESRAETATATVPLASDFDHEHLRLLTDKLSEKVRDLESANSRLESLVGIEVELATEEDPRRRIELVCESTRRLLDASYAIVGLLDLNDRTTHRLVTCGTGSVDWIKAGDAAPGILGSVVHGRRTVRGVNPGGDPRSLQLPGTHPRIEAYLATPIASAAHVHGWLCLVINGGRVFTADDEHVMKVLADQIGRLFELEHEVRERKIAEAGVRRERDVTQRYLDTAAVILLALDLEGRITAVNRFACSALGWTSDELLGRDWFDTCLPIRNRDAGRRKLPELAAGTRPVGEDLILTKSGEERLIEWRNTVLRNDTGRVIGTFSSGSDITERKRTKAALIQSEARKAAVLDSVLDCIVTMDADGIVSEFNTAAERTFGYTKVEAIGRRLADLIIPPAFREAHTAGLAHYTATGEGPLLGRVVEVTAMRKDGTQIPVELAITAILSDSAPIFTGVLRDLSTRKAAEAEVKLLSDARTAATSALRKTEERMRFALQSAGVGIWDMHVDTGRVEWSEILESQYGLAPGTFEGTFEAFVERIHPDDRGAALATVGAAMKAGSDFRIQTRTTWPDGTVRWLDGAGRFQLGDEGQPVRGIGISLDITERHSLEAQYQQAQKMDAIGRLAGGVAHDFNNLLTVILGHCEILLADLDPTDARQPDISEIQRAGKSAAALTRQLLAFSRKEIIEPKLLDLNATVAGLRPMLGRLIGEDVKVLLGLRHNLAPILADPGQMDQILMNLALNGRDAMPNGGTLTIETANVELDEEYTRSHLAVKPGAYVALTVSDTGIGITPEVQARLFEPFFTTKDVGKGTGLGLATVHGIATRSGGSVNVYSELGRGTSFTVYFPRAAAADVVVVTAPPAKSRAHSGSETVLLVEDATGLRDLTKRLLERQGYTVVAAADADEAVREFDRNPSIDVILTDVVMPGASGPELTTQLVDRRPGLKVVYMSGYTEEAIVHRGVLNPGIAFLHKPFTSEALGLKLREVLDRPE